MIKRVSSILLLTLFFLLTGVFNVLGAVKCGQLVGGTTFDLKSSTSAKTLENVKTYGEDTFSAGKYTLGSGNITIPGGLNQDGVFTHTVSGLPINDTDYTIEVEYSSSGETEFRFKWDTHGNQEVEIKDQSGSSGTKTFTIKSKNGSLSWKIQECGGQKASLVIKSIKVTGCIEQKIVSENNNILCKGEENTFRAIGLGENVTWKLNGNVISGATGSTYTASFLEGGKISASSSEGTADPYEFKAVLCCATSADRVVLALETFKTPNTNPTCKVDELHRGVSTKYTYTSNKGNIAEDQYAIVKNTDGTWGGWYKDNGAKIVYGNTQNNNEITDAILTKYNQTNAKNTSYDGFIIANCNVNKYDPNNPTSAASQKAIIFEYDVYGICPGVYHDFSSFISNIDMTAGHAEINVLFEVIEIDAAGNEVNPTRPLFTRETGYKACGDQSWKEYGGSFINGNNTNVKLKLYNNNQTATTNSDGNIVGNDVAVDDITFSRCVPRINVHFDKQLTAFTKDDLCNRQDVEITLYVGHYDYIINELLPGGFYIVEQREANANGSWGTWTPVMSAPKQLTTNSYEEVKVTVKANQGETQYRAIVAPTAADVETVRGNNNAQLPGCSIYNITKEDSYANLKYSCSNPQSKAPTAIGYSECPDASKPTVDLNTLITGINLFDGTNKSISNPSEIAQYGTIKFYDKNGSPVPGGIVSIPTSLANTDPSYQETYTAKFTQNKAADGTEYAESLPTEIKVIVSTVVPIVLKIGDKEYGPQSPYTVCINESVTLNALHSLKAGESAKWTAETEDGIETLTEDKTSITVTPTKSTTYTVEILNNTCRTPGSVLVNVVAPVTPVIASDKEEVCATNSINITDSNTETAETYQWYFQPENKAWGELAGYTSKNLENYVPQETGTYKVTTKVKECTSESNPVKVVVGAAINFTVTPTQKICKGSEAQLSITGAPQYATVQWYKGDVKNGEKIGDGEAEVKVSPEEQTTYTASVKNVCEATKETQVLVGGEIKAELSADEDICVGESSQLVATGGDTYTWYPTSTVNNAGISNPIATPTETTTFNVQIKTDVCTKDTFLVVNVHELPVIETITIEGEKQNRKAVPTVTGGQAPYTYSLNGEDYTEIPEEILNQIPIGWNLLYVMDSYDCKSQKEFYVEPVPIYPDRFFTPNNDGKNEEWTVENLDAYASYIIEIFDRHGKRLYMKKVGSFNGDKVTSGSEPFGWNGEYNGHLLPSDDYWYLITLEDIRKQYTGHFTLKR